MPDTKYANLKDFEERLRKAAMFETKPMSNFVNFQRVPGGLVRTEFVLTEGPRHRGPTCITSTFIPVKDSWFNTTG